MNADLLEYGALGALVLVLGAVGLWLRNWLKGTQQQQDQRQDRDDTREQRNWGERQNLAAALMSLGESSATSSVKLAVALDGLGDEIHANQSITTVALAELIEGQRAHEERASAREQRAVERHAQLMELGRQQLEQGQEVIKSLKVLNGRS